MSKSCADMFTDEKFEGKSVYIDYKDAHHQYREYLLNEIKECASMKEGYKGFKYWEDAMAERIKAYQDALAKFNELVGEE